MYWVIGVAALSVLAAMGENGFRIGGSAHLPLPQKNLSRATAGAFWLTFMVVLNEGLRLNPPFSLVVFGACALAAFYLYFGIRGSKGVPFDPVAAFWWGMGALLAAMLLLFGGALLTTGGQLVRVALGALDAGVLAAALVRLWCMWRPAPSAKLPDPATVPGMPMAGPASLGSAHAALSRRGQGSRPKFRT